MIDEMISGLAASLLDLLRGKRLRVATAESCTGGMIAAALTDVAGSSEVLERGFITYSNESKTELLGVPAALIAEHGAVSEQVAAAMAEGALVHSPAELAVSVTGIAGPGGGGEHKPVGTVWLAVAERGGQTETHHRQFEGDRAAVRAAARDLALRLVARKVRETKNEPVDFKL